MDGFSASRYEGKVETFDSCMLHTDSTQREVSQSADGQTSHENVQDDQENHESTMHQGDQAQQNRVVQIPSNTQQQQNMTLTPVRLPAILDGEFFTVIRVEDSNVTVRCLQCQKLLNGNLKSTGNFLSHIKRVHPFMVEKIKCKSNQRKPAMVYINLSTDRYPEIVKTKRSYRKYYKAEEGTLGNDDGVEYQNADWNSDSSLVRRRRSDESESVDVLKVSHNNSYIVEDEFDAIGRNVAAKLRNMRLDQRIIAEKLLNDILFEAQLGNLHRDSNVHV